MNLAAGRVFAVNVLHIIGRIMNFRLVILILKMKEHMIGLLKILLELIQDNFI
jgi:hypothetical protein